MVFHSINPATGETVQRTDRWEEDDIESALSAVAAAAPTWAERTPAKRAALLGRTAEVLRSRAEKLSRLITMEMGKLTREARAEVEKCAWVCEFYAEHGPDFLADEPLASDAGRSYVAYQPLGTVLGIMPWNFPFWQVFRFAAPALAAGNTCILKHASNVPLCAEAIEDVFHDAGLPAGVFRSFMVGSEQVGRLIADPRVHAISLTGSEVAGRAVAAQAGAALKETVLGPGGSDPFLVLGDAAGDQAARNGAAARLRNAWMTCTAAHR